MTTSERDEQGRVVVVGSLNHDVVLRCSSLPVPGQTLVARSLVHSDGGKGGNQATAAAKLGAEVHFVGAVGTDPFGSQARRALESDGVRTDRLHSLRDSETGLAVVISDDSGENCIMVVPGANHDLTPAQVSLALTSLGLRPRDVVLVVSELLADCVDAALRTAHAAGARTILNPAPPDGLDLSCLSFADIVTPNQHELYVLSGQDPDVVRGARTLLHASGGTQTVLVTTGADGAWLVTNDEQVHIPAEDVSVAGTVGAGDTLNGALAANLASGLGLDDAARQAVVAASLSLRSVSARGAQPQRSEIDCALTERPGP